MLHEGAVEDSTLSVADSGGGLCVCFCAHTCVYLAQKENMRITWYVCAA